MTYARTFDEEYMRRERLVGLCFFAIVIVATIIDVIEDSSEGSPWTHILTELFIISVSFGAALYLWRRLNSGWRNRTNQLKSELSQALGDIERWKQEAAAVSRGLTDAIERQLAQWGLSPAEQEIAFLLIKGLSLREVAEARTTTERTVRQQAAPIYRKSGLEGRAQLAAFFLEDLLPPIPTIKAPHP